MLKPPDDNPDKPFRIFYFRRCCARVRLPVDRAISKWVSGYTSQTCCPWNTRFATELRCPEFAPREFLAGKDARQLARDLLELTQEEFRPAFRCSPMKRAKLRGLKRNAAVVLGNIGTAGDIELLERVRGEESDAMVHEHAAWALNQLRARTAGD